MTKGEFIAQYIFNAVQTRKVPDGVGAYLVEEAYRAWLKYKEVMGMIK